MQNDQLVVSTRRLGTDLRELKASLRKSYSSPDRQVTSTELKQTAAMLAEMWLAELSQHSGMAACVSAKYISDLNVHFQRILVYAERASVRSRYDEEISAILKDYTANLVVPLMQGIGKLPPENGSNHGKTSALAAKADAEGFRPTAFVGHSFAAKDKGLVEMVTDALEAIGIEVFTGEKPRADRISDKVKDLIDAQYMFIGIFTRRDKLVGKNEWNTSAWIIDEKAYASRSKKLILLKETGVESIGGIQGDHEYIEFSRDKLGQTVIALLQLFKLKTDGLC
jgi:hypothetical protein